MNKGMYGFPAPENSPTELNQFGQSLAVGQFKIIPIKASDKNIPLGVAVSQDAIYEIRISTQNPTVFTGYAVLLLANDQLNTGAMNNIYEIGNSVSGLVAVTRAGGDDFFRLSPSGTLNMGKITVFTSMTRKATLSETKGINAAGTAGLYEFCAGEWPDQTTPWVSLGTLQPSGVWAVNGEIVVTRVR